MFWPEPGKIEKILVGIGKSLCRIDSEVQSKFKNIFMVIAAPVAFGLNCHIGGVKFKSCSDSERFGMIPIIPFSIETPTGVFRIPKNPGVTSVGKPLPGELPPLDPGSHFWSSGDS